MTRIPDSFLDELRARLPVSTVVARRLKDLKKAGSEWKALSPFNKEKTPSFTVNDHKMLWFDFSSGKGGDIVKFEMDLTGCTFLAAVEDLAQLAGIPMPSGFRPSRGHQTQPERRQDDVQTSAVPGQSTKRQIMAVYDYTDADGSVLYQVCRVEWFDSGKRKKTFLQRRHAEGDKGGWVWGLDADTYVRGSDGDWYRLTEARESWTGARLQVDEEIAHGLYRFAALREEMAQPEDERRMVFCPEGEKDCDTLAAWGLIATDSSGGSKKWSPHHAEELRGADVVVLLDNDKSGREYGHNKAASLRGIARRVRVLDWREHWPEAPEGADVTDWRNLAGGSKDRLFTIIDKLKDWTPQPPESSFAAVRFIDLDKPAREHEWLIKKVLTRAEVSIWYGPPSCGKSFLLTDAGLAIARGVSWMGMRVRPGLVIYQAGEGGLGLKKRLRAYRRVHRITTTEDLPFVLLPSAVDLFNADADLAKLITEIKAWAAFYDAPLELVAIDTFSAATPGANENASEDVSRVLARCRVIARETGAHVALVHHTTKQGNTPRGHSSLTGNVENAVEVIRTEETDAQDDGTKSVLRDIREFVVRKQKDGEDGLGRRFVLKQVRLGTDVDGEPETSCVVEELAAATARAIPREIPHGYVELKDNALLLMRALVKALQKAGRAPPADVVMPHGAKCVTVGDWQDALREMAFVNDPDDPDGKRLRQRCKKAIERTYLERGWNESGGRNLILKDREWVCRTSRKVVGIDAGPQLNMGAVEPAHEVQPLLAPGEEAFDFIDEKTSR